MIEHHAGLTDLTTGSWVLVTWEEVCRWNGLMIMHARKILLHMELLIIVYFIIVYFSDYLILPSLIKTGKVTVLSSPGGQTDRNACIKVSTGFSPW